MTNTNTESTNANAPSVVSLLITSIQNNKSKAAEAQAAADAEFARLKAMYNEIREIPGIVETTTGNRTPESCLAGGATKIINNAKKAGRTREEAKALAIASATKGAKKKYGWAELNEATLAKIDAALERGYVN